MHMDSQLSCVGRIIPDTSAHTTTIEGGKPEVK